MLSLRVPNLLCLEKSEYTPQDTCLVPQAILSVVQSLKYLTFSMSAWALIEKFG